MTHLLFHKTPNSVSSEPGAAQSQSGRPRLLRPSQALVANNFANQLHGTVENQAALEGTALLDSPYIFGPFLALMVQAGTLPCVFQDRCLKPLGHPSVFRNQALS